MFRETNMRATAVMDHNLFHSMSGCFLCLRCAAEVTDGSQYFVLLMITDGVISDMAQTKESVVNVSERRPIRSTEPCGRFGSIASCLFITCSVTPTAKLH